MKKVYLLVSGLLLTAGAVNAQVTTQKAYMPIQKNDVSTRMVGLAADRDPGDIIVEDDFSDDVNWNTEALVGEPNWEITATTPEDVVDYADEVMSETADNGFGVFNGITMLLTGTVEPADAVLEYVPTIVSPGMNPLTVVPIPTKDILRIFVSESQDLTLASVLDVSPLIISLNLNVPIPVISGGGATVTVGVSPDVYPMPALAILIEETSVSAFMVAIARAVDPIPDPGLDIVTNGTVEYPTPLSTMAIDITPNSEV